MRSLQYVSAAALGASMLLVASCAQIEDQTGRMLENAGSALYPDGPQHADYDQGTNYSGPAGDSFADQQGGPSLGEQVQSSAGKVIDNAGSVIQHTKKKLFVEDEEQRKQGSSAVERSAGRVLDNAGEVVRDGSARLWRPEPKAAGARWEDYDQTSGSAPITEQDILP